MVAQALEVVHQHLMVSTKTEKSVESNSSAANGVEGHKDFKKEKSVESNSSAANGVEGAKDFKKKKLKELKTSPTQPRRSSARIQALQKAEKALAERNAEVIKEDKCQNDVKARTGRKRSRKSNGEEGVVVEEEAVLQLKKKPLVCGKDEVGVENGKEEPDNVIGASGDKSDFLKVKETIRLFNKHYLQFVQVSVICVHYKTAMSFCNSMLFG